VNKRQGSRNTRTPTHAHNVALIVIHSAYRLRPNPIPQMFGKEELAAILRFGAEELFKPANEAEAAEKERRMYEEDIDAILERAEVRRLGRLGRLGGLVVGGGGAVGGAAVGSPGAVPGASPGTARPLWCSPMESQPQQAFTALKR
jgi:hypothetical protein